MKEYTDSLTVAELIQELQQLHQSYRVCVRGCDGIGVYDITQIIPDERGFIEICTLNSEQHIVPCECGHGKDQHNSLDSRPFGKWNCTYCRCVEYDAVTDEPFSGGFGDEATQRAWMRYADANEVPHDHEDEEAFKYGFDAGRSVENTKAILRWKTRCEELEVVAAALYLHQDGCRDQFELYRSVYLVPDFSRKSITCPRCGIVRNEGEMRICCM